MKVYERLAEGFVAEGVTDVFGLMGDGNMHWTQAMAERGVKIYDVRHEGAGLAMADGWARIAKDRRVDVPGVCTVTHGPGISQLATTMLVASRAQTPLVVMAGDGPDGDEEFVQRLDSRMFAEATEAEFVRVTKPETADEVVRRAFYIARQKSTPVLLSAPVSTQLMEFEDFDPYFVAEQEKNLHPPYPHPDAVDQAVRVLTAAKRPLVIVGRGAIWSDAGPAILALAERTGALVATTLMAKGWLAEDPYHAGISGLYSTRTAMELFSESDCVISFGASLNKYTTEHGYLYPDAQYIQVDVRPHAKMYSGRSADCYVHADARLAAGAIEKELAAMGYTNSGYRTAGVRDRLERALEDPAEFDLEPDTVDPREVCRVLDEVLPSSIGLVLGGGHQITFATMLFSKARSLMLANQHYGCIGQGLTTSIGASIAAGRTPLLLMEGDSGFMMYLAEFETAVRYDLPILVVVVNDQALGAEFHKMEVKGLKSQLATVRTPDLGSVGVALGGRGVLATSIDDVRRAAEEFAADPAPTIVDVRSSRSVLSIPYRRLHYGIDA